MGIEIDEDGLLDTDKNWDNIKALENQTLNANGESIEIKKIYKGSIIIEAKVKFCIRDSTLLMAAVKEILHHLMKICKVSTEKEFVLKVGLKIGPQLEGKSK